MASNAILKDEELSVTFVQIGDDDAAIGTAYPACLLCRADLRKAGQDRSLGRLSKACKN